VRGPVFGSLSLIISPIAASVKIATAMIDAIHAKCDPVRLIHPRYAAQHVTAGAVIARRPAITPMKKARARTRVEVVMAGS
jgi:hypothetical protein